MNYRRTIFRAALLLVIGELLAIGLQVRAIRKLQGVQPRSAIEATSVKDQSSITHRSQAAAAGVPTSNASLPSSTGDPPPIAAGMWREPTLEERKRAIKRSEIKKSEEYHRLESLKLRHQVDIKYGLLSKLLGLEPARNEQLLKLLVDKEAYPEDFNESFSAVKLDSRLSPREAREYLNQARLGGMDQIEAEIKVLLGESSYNFYEEYTKNIGNYMFVAELQQALSAYGATSLAPSQIADFRRIVASAPESNGIGRSFFVASTAQPSNMFRTPFSFISLRPNDYYISPSGMVSTKVTFSPDQRAEIASKLTTDQQRVMEVIFSQHEAARRIAQAFNF